MTKIIIALVAVSALIGLWYTIPYLKNNNGDDIYLFVESGSVFTKANKDASYTPLSQKKVLVKNGSYVKNRSGIGPYCFP